MENINNDREYDDSIDSYKGNKTNNDKSDNENDNQNNG